MNQTQLKIRRLRELLGAVREARHVVHAERTGLARALRMARRAKRRVDASRGKLALAGEEIDEYDLEIAPEGLIEWHREQVASLEHTRKAAEKRLKELERAKDAADPTGKAAERRKVREAQAKRKHLKAERERESLEKRRLVELRELETLATTDREKAALKTARAQNEFMLTAYTGADQISDKMREKLKAHVQLLRRLEALR